MAIQVCRVARSDSGPDLNMAMNAAPKGEKKGSDTNIDDLAWKEGLGLGNCSLI